MNEILTCAVAADGERIHRYVAGTLSADELAEFETHLLGCAECQMAVREGATVRSALRAAPMGRPAGPRAPGRLWWAVPLAVAAGGAVWLVAGREDALARLGRVAVAPEFAGVMVRRDTDSASRLADRGMGEYRDQRYGEAARLLAAVPAAERAAGLQFYLGVATLLAGAPADAARLLAEVPAESPYAAEAHVYRAKAWLQLGRADSALGELAAVPKDAAIAAHAAALADSVKGAGR